MNGYTQEEGASSPNEQLGYYAPPRRFVFDVYVPNNTSVMDSESYEPSKQGKNAGLQKFLPIIQEFIPPKDYKAAYEDVCEHILGAYTEIRELILTEAVEDMQEALKGTKIEGPNDCVKLLRELSGRLCGRRENTGKQKVQKAVGKYEKLVQDSELKVRELIRNEQIYRLNFDQLVLKNEESDRIIAEMKEKLAEDRALIEGLTKEASKLTAILRKKDEEIRNLRLECQAAQNQIEIPSPSESPVSADRHKGKTLSCTSNNLRMLLNDNRLTPTDFSSKITTVRKSSNRTPTSGKMKYVPKPGTLLDLTSMSSKALKINGLDKIKDTKETLRSQVGVQTERRKNGSGTPGINPSSRGVEGFNFFSSARGSSTQQISGSHTPDQANMKALRIKGRKDGYGYEEKSYSPLPMRAKHHEDFVSGPMKTDSFEEYPKSSVVLEKADRKRGEDYERKPSIRMEQGQNGEDKTRRRSGATRSRPMAGDMTGNSQKSLEHKNSLSSQRQTHKMTKSKSIVFENKSVKGGKNSSNPLVNIMMKKFTEQEFNSKKVFNG